MSTLSRYRRNVYSQNGEDGVLEEILSRLGVERGSFVEFGAWDGKHLSNTYRLLEIGWKAVYIEADQAKYDQLVLNMRGFQDRVTTIHALVEATGEGSLDNLLARTSLAPDFELLSIDIDSFDWHVWKGLSHYRPKIVIIEINSSIPVGVFQTHRDARVRGSSFASTVMLGRAKGYVPVCHTGNLFFVDQELVGRLRLAEEELEYPELLFDYSWKSISWEGATGAQRSIGRPPARLASWARRALRRLASSRSRRRAGG
ncbi:MAG: hypothetical protein ABSB61_11775 [Anaerolineales bacterium]|jgi:hypothetical protein